MKYNKKIILISIIFVVILTAGITLAVNYIGGGSKISSLESGLVAHYPLNGESSTFGSNLVVNGDFETGVISPFTGAYATVTADSSIKYSGSYSAKIVASGISGYGRIMQAISVTANKTYNITAWVYLDSSVNGCKFQFRNTGETIRFDTSFTPTANTWTKIEWNVTPTTTDTYKLWVNYGTSVIAGTMYVDNITFREITGVKDITPYANHGTNNGATLTTGRKGEANGAYNFDGTDDKILLGKILNPSNINNFTISLWTKGAINPSDYSYIIHQGKDSSIGSSIIWIGADNTGKIAFSFDGQYAAGATDIQFENNTWYHLVMTYNGSIMKGYIDGIIKKELSDASISNTVLNTNLVLGLSDILPSVRAYDGKISDLRVYNRALNDDEIKLLYDSFKPATSASDLNKGLVGHWMLDSENGAKDLTPNGNDGTANGGITIGGTTDRKGKTGGATDFEGGDDCINMENKPAFNITEAITLSAWVKLDTLSTAGIISKITGEANSGYGLWTRSDGTFEILLKPIGKNWKKTSSTYTLQTGQWYHVVGTYDKQYMRSYLNGQLNGQNAETASILIGTEDLVIGAITTDSHRINGQISDVRIYNRALSEDEIKLLYDQYKPKEASTGSLTKGLVLDMPLTTKYMKSSTVVSDLTPFGNDGTVSGAVVGSDSTSFDGTNDYIMLSDSNNYQFGFNDFSISIWTKINSSQLTGLTWHPIIDNKGANGISAGFGIVWNNNYNKFLWSTGNGTKASEILTQNPLNLDLLNQWIHVVMVREDNDSKNGYYYINGIKYELASVANVLNVNTSNTMTIGNLYELHSSYFFTGSVSNVKIYNRALSESEVKLLYEKGRN